jgi:molybdopterin synthase catalytic subunit
MVFVSDQPIDPQSALHSLGTPATGGIDLFIGTVRDNDGIRIVEAIEYAAYVPMAEETMRQIERELRSRWRVEGVLMVHRVGTLRVGEIAVLVAVGAAHRAEAFDACRFAIERIKADVPIWKKEFAQGESNGLWKSRP